MTTLHEDKIAKVQNLILPLETAVFGPIDAIRAQALGAKRLELNARGSYADGGLTPTVEDLEEIVPSLKVPIRLMIRPCGPSGITGADFMYTDAQFDKMKEQILAFKNTGSMNPLRGDGFVFGILKYHIPKHAKSKERLVVDVERCKALVEVAKPFSCVFHRAFDPIAASSHWERAIDSLLACGFHGVLTSGGTGSFYNNCEMFEQMCYYTKYKRFQIIIGGGVRADNVKHFVEQIAVVRDCDVAMHTAAIQGRGTGLERLDPDKLLQLVHILNLATPD